jgi:hypothetical protein
MTRSHLPTRKPVSRNIVERDLTEKVAPLPGGSWVEAALAEQGVVHGDIANCIADAAVFAASEAIADQGVEGKLGVWEIDALHHVIKEIVVEKLRDMIVKRIINGRAQPEMLDHRLLVSVRQETVIEILRTEATDD